MSKGLRHLWDQFLGRGDAAITVPPFDGALKSNNLLDRAAIVAELEAPEDLATDGTALYVADGPAVLQYERERMVEVAHMGAPITALTCLPDGGLAVAVEGRRVQIIRGPRDGQQWEAAGNRPFCAVNALYATPDGRLLATDGSRNQPYDRWVYDLMELGRSGRLLELNADGSARELANGLAYAFGVCSVDGGAWVCETWRHRLMHYGANGAPPVSVLDRLPGYPSRITPASDGGFWLSVFTSRTLLVEFVLREPVYRKRMMREIPPEYWVAPALNWGSTYLEPMQGAHIKTMGVLKPWAPPRSYGLVIRLSPEGLMRYSLHSRVDGTNHGITAAVEVQGSLFTVAKGPRRLLELPVAEAERSLLL